MYFEMDNRKHLILSEQNMSGRWYDGLETPQYEWNVSELR